MKVFLAPGEQGGPHVGRWEYDQLRALAAARTAPRHTVVDAIEEADVILLTDVAFDARFARVLVARRTRQQLGRLYVYSEKALTSGILPGLLTGMPRRRWDRGRYRTAAYAVYDAHGANPFLATARTDTPPRWHTSFLGRMSHRVRRRLLTLDFGDAPVVLRDTTGYDHFSADGTDRTDAQRSYAEITAASRFVLCPRGWSPSSIRVYEAMQLGRVPVIIADAWRPPFGPDWDDFSIRVREDEVHTIPERLAALTDDAVRRGQAARRAWEQHFAPATAFDALIDALEDLHRHRANERRWMLAWPFFFAAMSARAAAFRIGERFRARG